MVTSDLVRLCTQGAFALILTQHGPALWLMVLLQAGYFARASAFCRPAPMERVKEAVSVAERQSANRLLSATSDMSAVAGLVITAILIALVGNAWAVGAPRISTEIFAAIVIDIGRSVALFDITHFVIPNGDLGTRGGRTRKSSEGAHDNGGEHRKYADPQAICDHPS